MNRSYFIAGFIAVAALGWIISGQFNAGESSGDPAPRPQKTGKKTVLPKVRTRIIRAVERRNQLTLFGRTEAIRMVELKAEINSRVVSRAVKKGDWVKKGDILVHLAADDRPARLSEAKAILEQRRIAYEADLKLAKKLFRAKVKLAASRAELESARATVKSRRIDMERTRIRASFDGIVDDLPLEVGDYADEKTVVARVIDLDTILVVGEISERNIAKIKIGALAKARVSNSQPAQGIVYFVSKMGSEATRTFRIEVAIDNPDRAISEGLTAELRLELETVLAHRLSPAVLTLSDDGVVGVKTVNAARKVEFFPVRIIADGPKGIWLTGLPETAMLITVGQEFVLPGQTVEPVREPKVAGS
jgi:membrane fusion protein, multidrug efflux system